MALFEVTWRTSAERGLRKLPRDVLVRIIALAEALALDQRPQGAVKLAGTENTWRIRSGDYRLVYSISGSTLTVEVVKVAHRREVYR